MRVPSGLLGIVCAGLVACGGGGGGETDPFSPVAGAGIPARLTIVSGNGQTVEQHVRLPGAMTVRVTDALGAPVPDARVSFANVVRAANMQTFADGTAFPGRGNDIATLPMTYFHLSGMQTVTASVEGLPSVTFVVTVLPSNHPFDGLYACQLGAGDAAEQAQMEVVASQARMGMAVGLVDSTSGSALLASGGGLSQVRYSGRVEVAANGQGTLAGTAQSTVGGEPTGAARAWTCSRY